MFKPVLRVSHTLLLLTSLMFVGQAQAIDLSDFRLQDVIPILSEMKMPANLSSNQQALWLQVENKTKVITRVRDERRNQIQNSLKKRLKEKAPELRDIVSLMNQDEHMSAQENQEIREAWMTLYDALSDAQRDVVAALLHEQLLRVADHAKDSRPAGEGHKGGQGGQGGQRGGRSGMGNHSGSGVQ